MTFLLDEIRKRQLIIEHIRHNYKDFIIKKATTLANQLILDEIQLRMRNENFSKKIIERTYIKNISFISDGVLRINIVSDFVAESGFSISIAREFGTDQNKANHKHWVAPRVKKALSWLAQGKRLFSQGHFVSGIKALHIIDKTIDEKKPILIAQLNDEIKKWKESIH